MVHTRDICMLTSRFNYMYCYNVQLNTGITAETKLQEDIQNYNTITSDRNHLFIKSFIHDQKIYMNEKLRQSRPLRNMQQEYVLKILQHQIGNKHHFVVVIAKYLSRMSHLVTYCDEDINVSEATLELRIFLQTRVSKKFRPVGTPQQFALDFFAAKDMHKRTFCALLVPEPEVFRFILEVHMVIVNVIERVSVNNMPPKTHGCVVSWDLVAMRPLYVRLHTLSDDVARKAAELLPSITLFEINVPESLDDLVSIVVDKHSLWGAIPSNDTDLKMEVRNFGGEEVETIPLLDADNRHHDFAILKLTPCGDSLLTMSYCSLYDEALEIPVIKRWRWMKSGYPQPVELLQRIELPEPAQLSHPDCYGNFLVGWRGLFVQVAQHQATDDQFYMRLHFYNFSKCSPLKGYRKSAAALLYSAMAAAAPYFRM